MLFQVIQIMSGWVRLGKFGLVSSDCQDGSY